MTSFTPPYLIGIDIGTSSTKSVLLDRHGRLVAWAGQEYPLDIPQPGWAEQDPEHWRRAVLTTVQCVLNEAQVRPQEVVAVGLSGQMHTLVCLGTDGRVLRPAILWADARTAPQVQRLTGQIGRENLAAWSGNPLAAGFMLASWQWLREQEPDTAAAARWLMLPKDVVRYWLTGQIGAEPSDAASTLLFDPHQRAWSRPLLAAVGLDEAHMPPLGESAGVAGGLLPEMARALGLLPGTPVVYGGSDQAAQALAQGVIREGQVSCTIGTGGQLFAPLRHPLHDPALRLHLFCHVLPDTWHLESAILSAGLALRWLRDQVWPGSAYTGLVDEAAGVQAAGEGLFFLPYLSGERTPHMDAQVRAAWVGLDLHHTRAHLVRAALEGVVFALRQGLDVMRAVGVQPEMVTASGGGTRHPLWLQMQANVFNLPLSVSQVQEAAGRGAALLAGVGAGVYPNAQTAVEQTLAQSAMMRVLPDPAQVEMYAAAYQRYCGLYPALRLAGFAGAQG